ncbi:MAG: type IV pilus twitching motility protein PilT [Lachnospiraceae bacterium]
MKYDMVKILQKAELLTASDLHITVGRPPIFRIRGELVNAGEDALTPEDTQEICNSFMDEAKKELFMKEGQIDFSWSMPGVNRYRINVYRQRSSCAAALRRISSEIPTMEELNLPNILKDLSMKPQGLILITGAAGSGKSTTLAAILGYINKNRNCHVITIEDPIEYLHRHDKSVVTQREIGSDTASVIKALRAVLREDPDVIQVGELYELESISTAIKAAETGHLVLSSMYTLNAAQTIDRVIDSYPPHLQHQIRSQLANVLQAIICQQLLPSADGTRLVPALEIMLNNDIAKKLIREGEHEHLDQVLNDNIRNGMMPMDYALAELVKSGEITQDIAYQNCTDVDRFEKYITI